MLCERKSAEAGGGAEGYIFVEATKECIPVNACLSEFSEINENYCIELDRVTDGKFRWDGAVERYIYNVLGETVKNEVFTQHVDLLGDNSDEKKVYAGYSLNSGNYIVFSFYDDIGLQMRDAVYAGISKNREFDTKMVTEWSCWAYGYPDDCRENTDEYCSCKSVKSRKKCEDIADFASLLNRNLCKGDLKGRLCSIQCGTEPKHVRYPKADEVPEVDKTQKVDETDDCMIANSFKSDRYRSFGIKDFADCYSISDSGIYNDPDGRNARTYTGDSAVGYCKRMVKAAENCVQTMRQVYKKKMDNKDISKKQKKIYQCVLDKLSIGKISFPVDIHDLEKQCK